MQDRGFIEHQVTRPDPIATAPVRQNMEETMTNRIRHSFALSVLPALLLAGCGGSNDSGSTPSSSASVSVTQEVNTAAAVVGDHITWTTTATNTGSGATSGVVTLLSTVPANIKAASVATTGGAACGPVLGTLTCTVPAGLAAGASATVVLSATATAAGTFTSTVNPSGPNVTGCASQADCTSTTTVSPAPVPPNVTVTASVNKTTAVVGDTITWTLSTANSGGSTTAPITLTDTLPTGIGAVTVASTTGGATCGTVSGSTLACTVPAGNGVATVVLSAPANAAGSLVNTVAPGTGASCAAAANCTTTTTVSAAASPNVTVSSSVDKTTAHIGDTVKWTLTAVNSGTGATTAPITLTDTLPTSGISGAAVITTTGGTTCGAVSGNTVTCTVPAGLAATNGTATAVISATASAAGNLTNTVAPGTGASCTSSANCTTTTAVSSNTPVQIAGSCGVMIDSATLNSTFGGTSGSIVAPLSFLGTTSSAGPNVATYVAGLATSGDAATFESYPGSTPGPTTGAMVTASGTQFICASQNGSATTGASSSVKYTSDLVVTSTYSSLAGNIQISKAVGNYGFVTFNLPSLSEFSFQFFRNGSNGYAVDYTTDGVTWNNIVTTSATRSITTTPSCNGSTGVCTELNVLSTNSKAAITQPLVLRVSNINTSGTMVIQGLMIKP
jgi:uncharacterized repeat protein (TIGR01451 family)